MYCSWPDIIQVLFEFAPARIVFILQNSFICLSRVLAFVFAPENLHVYKNLLTNRITVFTGLFGSWSGKPKMACSASMYTVSPAWFKMVSVILQTYCDLGHS